ncbi:MAG: thioredoxin domain-containing protein [Chloroflexi bacterium]|nr:thioredoxin domain-containing protein [Chloroflexota bacterium]
MPNRLATETSPYLLQHANNPVDWSPWGPDALARAKLLDRPIFLSIGYAACHWCHVMERESFEDEATARYLNDRFVSIKVDREERPDLDQVYMAAVQAMTGGGGWPMSVFLTPEGRPFYGGTYFPDEPRHGMPSFRQVLEGVDRAWREQRAEVEAAGGRLVQGLVDQTRLDAGQDDPTAGLLEAATGAVEASFDPSNGGWGRAPKFPQPMTIEFLLRRHVATGDARPLAIARRSLDAMAAGGIHDQLGGGFHRYSTDARWLVPHFEQMLYDNAQLARVYLHAWQACADEAYLDVATGALDYMIRELTTDDGAFAASQDDDTDGEEGATFVWTADEVRTTLGERSPLFEAAYGVTESGNWEGRTILSRVASDGELAGRFGLSEGEVRDRLQDARRAMLTRRSGRPQPARDGKALAAWNGLAVGALADAAVALATSRPRDAARYRTAAERAATTLLDGLQAPDGSLGRSWKDGRATGHGVLEDYTHLADGLLALYVATFDEGWFSTARALMDRVLERFADPAGGFFDTADDHERLVTRPKDVQDNAVPSGNAVAAEVLLRLHAWTGASAYRSAADRGMRTVVPYVARYATGFARWLSAMDLSLAAVQEVAIVGAADDAGTLALLAETRRGYRPNRVVSVAADPAASAIPLLADRLAIDGRPTAYLCRGFVCRLPVTDPEALRGQLDEAAGAA